MMLKIEVCLMNNQKELEEVWEATKSLEGTVIYGDNIAENLQFIHKSKELAKKTRMAISLYNCFCIEKYSKKQRILVVKS